MSKIGAFVLLAVGILGLSLGAFVIYSVVMRKHWAEEASKRRDLFPWTIAGPFLNKINSIWIGIVLVIFFGGLIFAIIQESF